MFQFMMTYTPLIASDTFTGVTADITAAAAGILGLVMIILGVRYLINMFR